MSSGFAYIVCALALLSEFTNAEIGSEIDAVEYLGQLESRYSAQCNRHVTKRWNYNTNVNPETSKAMSDAETEYAKFQAEVQKEIVERFPDWRQFKNESVKRQLRILSVMGTASMPIDQVEKMNELQHEMDSSYATTLLCGYKDPDNCTYRHNQVKEILKSSTDPKELSYFWTSWHDKMSQHVPPTKYRNFVEYQSTVAKANGFKDMTELWLFAFGDGTPDWSAEKFKNQIQNLWEEIKPLYETLHAYVRMKIRKIKEFDGLIDKCGYIPIYLTGNGGGQEWTSISDKTKPFPDVPSVDASKAMIQQKYTPRKIFEVAEKFFTDLGLMPMTSSFWEKSVLEYPTDGRHVIQTAQAEDLCFGKTDGDYRIKQFTKVNMEELGTAHHESGHVQYFMQYAHLPFAFRDAANPGFHEALGDTLGLAVSTPKHLQCSLGLDLNLKSLCESSPEPDRNGSETDINYLYQMALDKLVLLSFAISLETWRWEAFEGKIFPDQYNHRWWDLMLNNMGVSPPTNRSLPHLFDPAGKYHIVGNIPYIPYFASHILQFQFYEAMCIAAGEYDPSPNSTSRHLHQCDFDGSKPAGKLLGDMMKLGLSKDWPVALETLTGSREMSVSALKKYFQPLIDHLEKELDENAEVPGFGDSCEHVADKFLRGEFESRSTELERNMVLAEWNYLTNLTTENSEKSSEQTVIKAQYEKDTWKRYFKHFNVSTVENPSVKRQLELSKVVGTSALSDEKIKRLKDVNSEMMKIYGTAKICPFEKQNCNLVEDGLSLNPGIEKILTESRNYDELAYAWTAWRNATGKKMRSLYYEMVDLENEAAKLNDLKTATDFSLYMYETPDFREVCEALWQQVKPLFVELHGYVRYKLRGIYPQISENGPLPAHVFGNMWSQSWKYLVKVMIPFPNATRFDATEALEKRYNADPEDIAKMFDVANEFFTSLGLEDMSEAYGPKAMISRPKNRDVDCHASAWDMITKDDFRLKMCTKVNHEDFVTIHHELGHIAYMKSYRNLPITFRGGANPGFHEATGDVISLSVGTARHMKKIGLIESLDSVGEESTLNFLMQVGLDKLALLPFTYLLDAYRWKIYDGVIPKDKFTYHWVEMVSNYQGVVPPVERTEEDFDAGSKYHVPADAPYICYFVSLILQFQIHKSLCEKAGEYPVRPLHECDIYGNKEAGESFRKMLERGASLHWGEVLKEAIGTDKMDATAIQEYFSPLMKYLQTFRKAMGYSLGWNETAFEEFVK